MEAIVTIDKETAITCISQDRGIFGCLVVSIMSMFLSVFRNYY